MTGRFRRLATAATSIAAATAFLAACGSQVGGVGPATVIATSTPESPSGSRTFQYAGKRQGFRVPAGVKWLTVVARGASGGYFNYHPVRIGRGGRVYAIIPVTPGERLVVFVGGEGSASAGGFNGGATGGQNAPFISGGGGGGASDVRQGGDRLSNRVLVAGGGGGEGAPLGSNSGTCYCCVPKPGNGGNGGGSTGGAGQLGAACYAYQGGVGGSGGSQKQGGAGGSGGEIAGWFGNSGYSGSLGKGGVGGAGCHRSSCSSGNSGGGGGGGYYGGGGGGTGAGTLFSVFGGGGGGGGSSYIEPRAQKFQSWQGWKNAIGNGLVVFSW
jgi:hypothetical protein